MKKRGPWFRKARKPVIEFLDERLTPSAIFELWAGILTLTGTNDADSFQVRFTLKFSVTVNDDAREFPAADVAQFHIFARGGNDRIDLDKSVLVKAWISGGSGDDVIRGGSGDDLIEGDSGKDQIDGSVGDDVIRGGFGDDTIHGGEGNDLIDGDQDPAEQTAPPAPVTPAIAAMIESVERVSSATGEPVPADVALETAPEGTPGNDQIFGEAGNDTIRGGSGDDVIIAGTGNDRVLGEEGNDNLRGGAGRDRLDGGPGVNRVDGGSGADSIRNGTPGRRPVIVPEQVSPRPSAPTEPLVATLDSLLEGHSAPPAAAAQDQSPQMSVVVPAGEATPSTPSNDLPQTPAVPIGNSGSVTPEVMVAAQPESGGSATPAARPLTGLGVSTISPVTQQVDLVLAGAVMSDATSDSPAGAPFNGPDREKRRPTFLYINPLPLPDLIPDIELPLA
jgi:hypothetical protein